MNASNPESPESPESPGIISGHAGKAESRKSGISLDYRTPDLPRNPDPLTTPGLLRFLLGKSASDMLADAGQFFVLQAYRSPQPKHDGRFVVLALPVSKDTCDECARVAKGTHRAIRKPSPKSDQ